MNVLGGLCFAVAALITVALPIVSSSVSPMDGERAVTTALLMVPLWIALCGGMVTTVFAGGFAWLARARAWQLLLAVTGSTALVAVTWMCAGLWDDAGEAPWLARAAVPALSFLLPATAAATGWMALDPHRRTLWPMLWWRAPLVVVGGGSIALLAGLFGYASVDDLRNTTRAAVEADHAATGRDAAMLAEVAALDPVEGFVPLLRATNIYNAPAIRDLAVRKVASRAALNDALTALIGRGGCAEALTYLEGGSGPEPRALAPAIGYAVDCMADRVRDDMHGEGMLYDDNFDGDTRRVLAVVDRYAGLGVDHLPAVRRFRAAMDEPNRHDFKPRCRVTLDRWIARHATAQ